MNIPLSSPDIGEREIEYVSAVLRSRQLSLGPWLKRFEERFAEYVGARYAVAASSGTAGLHMCVRAMEIGPGDEVITTPFSFVASTNCVLYEGASPVLLDIDPETYNLAPEKIREFLEENCTRSAEGRAINRKSGRTVKAILPVHVFGLPCEMDAIGEIAREYGLLVLEDACEAIGAKYRGKPAGTFGDAAVFAFYPNKQMTSGEGGMVVTNDARIAEECRSLRNQGRDANGRWLTHVRLGFNYRLSDLHCALGLAQLERIEELLAARQAVADEYSHTLAANKAVRLPVHREDAIRSWFVYVIELAGGADRSVREAVRERLQRVGIASQGYFPAVHRQPYFSRYCSQAPMALPNCEKAADRCLALPFSACLTKREVNAVCKELETAIAAESGALKESKSATVPA
ncbi:MAG: DegT/DnrJ/EryC1/StrS family aminotransferase [Candidatus Acidiferrales bacterium]